MLAAFIAGTVDAIAGGGGLITLPALLAAGLDPHFALGTNKGQSVFGSSAALFRFWRAGRVDSKLARFTFPLSFAGALVGATLVLSVPASVLRVVVIALLLGAALIVFLRNPSKTHAVLAVTPPWAAPLMALCIGGYDGF
ncbi:MAG: TSUP family transporter, partial [Myxococcaceae bacterium]